jgi:non-ribosomal peptide synthetase component E (peptide arylation enzyme)
MKEHLARYKVPKHLTVLSALPKGATGKIDKRSLKALHPGAPSDVA